MFNPCPSSFFILLRYQHFHSLKINSFFYQQTVAYRIVLYTIWRSLLHPSCNYIINTIACYSHHSFISLDISTNDLKTETSLTSNKQFEELKRKMEQSIVYQFSPSSLHILECKLARRYWESVFWRGVRFVKSLLDQCKPVCSSRMFVLSQTVWCQQHCLSPCLLHCFYTWNKRHLSLLS